MSARTRWKELAKFGALALLGTWWAYILFHCSLVIWEPRWPFESLVFNLHLFLLLLLAVVGLGAMVANFHKAQEREQVLLSAMNTSLRLLAFTAAAAFIQTAIWSIAHINYLFVALWCPAILAFLLAILISLPRGQRYPYVWALFAACLLSAFIASDSSPNFIQVKSAFIPYTPTVDILAATVACATLKVGKAITHA